MGSSASRQVEGKGRRIAIVVSDDVDVVVDTTSKRRNGNVIIHTNSASTVRMPTPPLAVHSPPVAVPVQQQLPQIIPATPSSERPSTPQGTFPREPIPRLGHQTVPQTTPLPQQRSTADILLAAAKFHQIAVAEQLVYAIVGGITSHIYGNNGGRSTRTLDILMYPRNYHSQISLMKPVIDELFNKHPDVLNFTKPDRRGHIVVTNGNMGVPINFIDCINNIFHFPPVVYPSTDPLYPNGSEPTVSIQQILPRVIPGASVPVLLPRVLLQQRLLHFSRRPGERPEEEIRRKQNDLYDMAVYLQSLQREDNQSFTCEEGQLLLPKVKEALRFAESRCYMDPFAVSKWRWINIDIKDGDWRD